MDRYLLTVTTRYDGCDKFGRNKKWGLFPSASVGWRVSEEDFMKNFEKLSNLKLRVSYGQTGNSNIGSNAFSFYSVNRQFVFNSVKFVGTGLTQIENPNLKWETTTELNLGLDIGFFDNRLSAAIEYYNKVTSDILGYRNLKPWALVSGVAANLGKTKGQGVEVTLNTVNIDTKDFRWNTDFTFTRYRDRWKERSPDVVLAPWQKVDEPIRSIYYYKTEGIIQVGETVPHMPNAVPGNIKIKDINGFDENMNYTGQPDGKIDQADMVYLGTSDPDFTIGLNNKFTYKNFDLSVNAHGSFNQLAFNHCLIKYIAWSGNMVEHGTNLSAKAKDIWTSENQNGKYPSDALNTTMGDDAYAYQKASFFRIQNITLGYTLPARILNNTLSHARVYLDAQNPFVFTNWNGMDPETDIGNKAPYPNQRSFTIGLNVKF
jgi:TonB-linked SusC/RagA family outer membrane protein